MQVTSCRICHNKKLVRVGSLGDIAMSNFTKRPSRGILNPLTMVHCKACGLLQLSHNPPRNDLYGKHYWYTSGINPTIVNDLSSIVEDGLHVSKKQKGVWLDIGANDGTLLSLVPKTFHRIGVDPASNLIDKLKKHTDMVIEGFFDHIQISQKADIITAIAIFYDLPNPNLFTKKLKETLSDDGIAIIQLMTLSPMIENNDVGNICHEHIEYYSYKSLAILFDKHGLEIFKVKTNSMNGGSYRLFIRHKTKGSVSYPEKTYNVQDLKDFFARVRRNKQSFLQFVKDAVKNKKKIAVYGASTKGNTILQYYGLDYKTISQAVDVNPEKKGRFMVASKIPITDTIHDVDYLWVLPYGFLSYFLKKESAFRKRGGKFVVSTPEFKII